MVEKIDAHTHIGNDEARKKLGLSYKCDPELLIKLAQKNLVKKILTMPTPGYIYCPNLRKSWHQNVYGVEGIPDLLKIEDGQLYFKCKQCEEIWRTHDPFSKANKLLFMVVKQLNERYDVKVYPLPIVYPMKPGIEKDVYTFYEKYRIKGIKIEGIVDKTNPLKYIDSPLTDTLKELELRILFHTDSNPYANPRDILKFARYTGIKCQLAHACRLDTESLKQLRKMNNVVTDLSPIQHLMKHKERLLCDRQFKDYDELISHIMNLAGRDKVIAGTDYNYQGWTEESYDSEWKVFERYCGSDILYENASKFWDLE
jgi:hypothetical protein